MKQFTEGIVEAARFFLGIDSLRVVTNGEGGAKDLGCFLVGQLAEIVSEELDPVRAGKQHVDRKVDAEHLGDLGEAGLYVAGGGGNGIACAGFGERLDVEAEQHAARSL